ncbi:hypothetical protein M0R72_06840 [Candidatus Pacearchaeota archaeon]|jgi:hypothetical protein|nr:hypothetical protein [Candidatus Pacearchaeota archaeon]
MPKLFDSFGNEIGKEYFMTLNSSWDGQFFEFANGAKVVFARKYGGMGFDRLWENTNGGLETYEHWRRHGCLPT